ncbi:unnamed protein product, partial [Ectocarpus sp. 12 AP-2014]
MGAGRDRQGRGGGDTRSLRSLSAVWFISRSGGHTYAHVCAKELDGVTCAAPFRGVTRFWDDFAAYEASVTSDADVLEAVNVEAFPDGFPANQQALFGNGIVHDDYGNISGAKAIIQGYALASGPDDDADINKEVFEWNEAFQDKLEASTDDFADVFEVFYLTSRSFDDALEESVSSEIFLYIAIYVIMVLFVTVALGRCCAGPVERRSWLGVGGIVLVVAAGLAAYGLNSGFGVPFTSLSQILPFILVGIGVDDMFVIVAAYDHTDHALPVEERVALGVKRCGVSVTYTSLTNFFAFLLGAQSSLPAVQYFCFYAATAILFDFFLQARANAMMVTAFVALLTMDANRQKAGKIDWCCCFTSPKHLEKQRLSKKQSIQREVAPRSTHRDVTTDGGDGGGGGGTNGLQARGQDDVKAEAHELSKFGRFVKEKFSPCILSGKGKALVLLCSASLLAAGIYGVTQATQGIDVLDLAPDDHYARDYTARARSYNMDILEWCVPMRVYTREVDYPDMAVQAEMQSTDDLLLANEFVEGQVESWLTSFIGCAESSDTYSANVGSSGGYAVYEDRATFYTALFAFTEDGANARFLEDVTFNDDGTIKISRSDMFLVGLTDTEKNVDALRGTREVVDQSALNPAPFAYSGVFVSSEQFVVICGELMSSFGLALAAVFALSLLVLGKVAAVVLACVTLAIVDAELLGFVYHYGLDVNSITVIQLIMAVGLVVDYMVHLVHYFLHQARAAERERDAQQDPRTPKDTRIADTI